MDIPHNLPRRDADDELLQKILEFLGHINFEIILREKLEKRTPGTGSQVIDSVWFRDWMLSLSGGIIWGTGMPGAGKTVTACIVVEHLQKLAAESESNDVCVLFAFCRYTESLMVIHILLAILRQLLENHPQVLPFLKPMYERHKREGTRPSEAEVIDLLRQIVTSGLFKQTFYILDGLDEAASGIQVNLLEILSSLPVNFFITSRPMDSLKDLIPNARFFTMIASDSDIALLIDEKIYRMPVLRRLLIDNATLKSEVVSMITSKSSGMFLLASLHIDMLRGCTNVRQVRKALEGVPSGMDSMYDATMERIKALPEHEADLVKWVLIWVTYARRLLTAEELGFAVSVSPTTFRFDDMEPVGIEVILWVCCGLLQVGPTQLVRFVHYTTAEYMIRNLERHYSDDPHALIASSCIALLRHYGFHDMSSQNVVDDQTWNRFASSGKHRTVIASYPYEYWGFHLKKSRLTPALALEFLDDCKQYPIFWDLRDTKFHLRLPPRSYDNRFSRLEMLHSIHVAAIYGIREYFNHRTRTPSVLNGRGSAGSTPLILASATGGEDVVAFLMGVEGVDCNLMDGRGQTAMFVAVANHQAGAVKVMLSSGKVDVNRVVPGWRGGTPLTCASRTGQRNIVRLLLEVEGIDVNEMDSYARTALALAVQGGYSDIVRLLLQTKGIDMRGALDKALDNGRNDILNTLLEVPEVTLDEESAFNSLMRAVRGGKPEAVMTVLKHGKFDVNAKDEEGRSALAHSLRNPQASNGAAKALLQIPGIDVNSVDKYGTTILMLAASRRETDASKLVETILRLGSLDINAKDESGQTALVHAASTGSWGVVKLLLGIEGVDWNGVDAQGRTPLMMATESGRDDVVGLLLERSHSSPGYVLS
ncbi:ankyrin [Coprinopsis marcescibilis]|uniref:Ankyrin n=1 Tax=Coprinopsis marcescibilis TaxID=230819 RepID=A0A5C3KA87_COPMA|nr:ankyrin [Coprinopsis marcescibilis]